MNRFDSGLPAVFTRLSHPLSPFRVNAIDSDVFSNFSNRSYPGRPFQSEYGGTLSRSQNNSQPRTFSRNTHPAARTT
jgi:hypothetical protein